MRYLLILLSFFCFSTAVYSQSGSKNPRAQKAYDRGRVYYDSKMNEQALAELDMAIQSDPEFFEAYLLRGDLFKDTKHLDQAVNDYKRALELKPDAFPMAWYNLANLELSSGKYADSKIHFEKVLTYSSIKVDKKKIASDFIIKAAFGDSLMKNPVPFSPQNLGEGVNTKYQEYLPAITADDQTLIFTRRQPRNAQTANRMNPEEEDFYMSKKEAGVWSKAMNLGSPLNTNGNEGAQCISPDGKLLFFTACNRPDGSGSCDIYVSYRTGNAWSIPTNLGPTVNAPNWDSQPSISFDSNTLYFISNRAGGLGGMDIWTSTRGKDGKFQTPVNAGETINTSGNEFSPFIHTDDRTLYFASDGHLGMGGFDIFLSRRNPDKLWNKPVNLGYPINTFGDENSLIVNSSGNTGYFASERPEGKGGIDLYSFEMYEAARPIPVSYVKGKVSDEVTGNPLAAQFEILDVKSGETVLYSASDPRSGEYLITLPAGKRYALNISKPGYLFYSEAFSLDKATDKARAIELDIELKPIKSGSSVVLKNIFFATDKFELMAESGVELAKLAKFMLDNPNLKIEVSGHTDNTGNAAYNKTLSEKRAKSVYEHLIKNGVPASRLIFKGYGDTKPLAGNDTEEGKALNRRTEFTIISN